MTLKAPEDPKHPYEEPKAPAGADADFRREPRDAIEEGTATMPAEVAGGGGGSGGGARRSTGRRLATGLLFVAPNILGFLSFTLLPLLFAMALAFTNWDLKLHNALKREQGSAAPLEFVGFDNFLELLFEPTYAGQRGMLWGLIDGWTWDPGFWKFLGNTLFFMMGMPFSIALSLLAAVLLSKDLTGGTPRNGRKLWVFAGGVIGVMLLTGGVLTVMSLGSAMNGMVLLFCAIASGILLGGLIGAGRRSTARCSTCRTSSAAWRRSSSGRRSSTRRAAR